MKQLTPLQRRVLHYVENYIEKHDYAPLQVEIADGLGLTRGNAVKHVLTGLRKKRYIDFREGKRRSIVILRYDD